MHHPAVVEFILKGCGSSIYAMAEIC